MFLDSDLYGHCSRAAESVVSLCASPFKYNELSPNMKTMLGKEYTNENTD